MMALLGVRFLAELGMLFCLAVGGWQWGDSLPASVVLGVEVTLFAAALMSVIPAEPTPTMAVVGVLVWRAFLVSIPSRGHEPVPEARV